METVDKHVRIVAYMYIFFGSVGLLGSVAIWAILSGFTPIEVPLEAQMLIEAAGLATWIFHLMALFSVLTIFAGRGLLHNQGWARKVVIGLSVLGLLEIPVGTGVGLYSLWALNKKEK